MQRGAFTAPALHAALSEVAVRRDRSFITGLSYGVLRWSIYLDAALAPLLKAPQRLPERVAIILRAAAFELLIQGAPRFAVTNEWVRITRKTAPKLSGLVNAVLRRLEPPADLDEATEVSLPAWLYGEFRHSLGADASAAARGMLEPEPFWLAALAPQAAEILRAEGSETARGPVPGSLAVRLAEPLAELESFSAGLVQPMNPSSLLAARLLGAGPGDRVLDLASGHGIKGAVLAAAGAQVTSVELDAAKLQRGKENLARLQLSVEHIQADLRTAPAGLAPAPFVLLDAPCTGTGTLRGNPEIKLRLGPADVEAAARLQSVLLDSAASLTAPGGRLLYAVCALTHAEGPGVIDEFLQRHTGFSPEPLDLAAAGGEGLELRADKSGSYVLPVSGLDGFYLASLRRDG